VIRYLAYYTVGTKVIREPVRFDVPASYQGFATAWLHDHDLLPKNGLLYRLEMA
jgi:hypothetical protein